MDTKEYDIDKLPELPLEPFELAGKLGHAGSAPVLTIIPDKIAAPQPPAEPDTAAIRRAECYTRDYLVQVTYPKVVCYPQNALSADVAWRPSDLEKNKRDVEVIARHERYYKLTSYNGAKLNTPYFCTVHYGPWSAVVKEEQSCIHGQPNRWTLSIVTIPDVGLIWDGIWDDIPPYTSLTVFMNSLTLVSEKWNCCPGYRRCDPPLSPCIDNTVNCGDDPLPP